MMSDELAPGRGRIGSATLPPAAAVTSARRRARAGWSAEQLDEITPRVDARVSFGYDPDADGSYYPDPEDYPPLSPDADGFGETPPAAGMSNAGWGSRPAPASSPGPTGEVSAHGRATAATSPLAAGSKPGMSPQRRRSSGLSLLVVAVTVLGLLAAGLVSYRLIVASKPDTSTVTTPTEQAPQDLPANPQAPATPAPEFTTPTGTAPALNTRQPVTDQDDDRDDDRGRGDD